MELTRRDAMVALAALGGASGVAAVAWQSGDPSDGGDEGSRPGDERVRETLVAVAEVVYPDELSGVETFVSEFAGSRLAEEPHATGIREAVATLEARAEEWYEGRVAALSPDTRDRLLRETGADTADSVSDGSDAERIRYYVINELLLALYSSPAGGELVGLENPPGHPGGIDSYTRGPQ